MVHQYMKTALVVLSLVLLCSLFVDIQSVSDVSRQSRSLESSDDRGVAVASAQRPAASWNATVGQQSDERQAAESIARPGTAWNESESQKSGDGPSGESIQHQGPSQGVTGSNANQPPPILSKSVVPKMNEKILCIAGPFWGQTFNRIIQTANALTLAKEKSAVAVGFDTKWTAWYETFLDPRPDIRFNYTGPCIQNVTPKEIFQYYKFDMRRIMKYLQVLIPKVVYRDAAHAAMASLARPITTVHRRDLDGKCVGYAQNYTSMVCPNYRAARRELSVRQMVDICRWEYKMLATETQGSTVVLLTDGQVPALDRTFPYISNHSFPVQAWMMALSDVHYGNPFSTVDLIVHFWRVGLGKATTTRPSPCYRPEYHFALTATNK
jgi:hypothetical protein